MCDSKHWNVLQCQKALNCGSHWDCHKALKQLKTGNSSYIKHLVKQLEKTPWTEIQWKVTAGNLVVEVKRLIHHDWQETSATNIVLQFDTKALSAYKEFGKIFVEELQKYQ